MNFGKIADLFQQEGYVWSFSDGQRIPNEEEIRKTIFAVIDQLEDKEDNTQVEVGRLIIRKKGHFFDVFVHIAEYS